MNAVVVEAAWSPEPLSSSVNDRARQLDRPRVTRTVRDGRRAVERSAALGEVAVHLGAISGRT